MRKRKVIATLALGIVPVAALVLATQKEILGIDLTVPYAAEGPGPTFNTLGTVDDKDVVAITGADLDETTGALDMTTVMIRYGMTLSQALNRWATTDDSFVPIDEIFPPGMTRDEVTERNKKEFSNSESAATLAALTVLGKTTVTIAEVTQGSAAQEVMGVGDTLVAVDGVAVDTPLDAATLVRGHAPGTDVPFTIIPAGTSQEKTIMVTLGENPNNKKEGQLGVLLELTPTENIHVTYNLDDIGGPSAGLMFSLAVIDKLSPGELNRGRIIAGTGTIDVNGQVGVIGGIAHKLRGAENSGAEIFLAPKDNCADLKGVATPVTVISVDSLEDAVEKIGQATAGEDVETCPVKKISDTRTNAGIDDSKKTLADDTSSTDN